MPVKNYAFAYCFKLKSILLPNVSTYIGDYAFSNCISLESFTIPEGVTYIGTGAFSGCSLFESIVIPNSVTKMGNEVFYLCTSLKSVILSNKLTSIGSSDFSECVCLESVVIPDSVTTIGDCAFNGCKSLKTIKIPQNIKSIGVDAFLYCDSLISVPNSYSSSSFCSKNVIKGFEGTCGDDCNWKVDSSMVQIKINGSGNMDDFNPDQFWYVFLYILKYAIIEGVNSIGTCAFQQCVSLESVTILNGVNSIGNGAFSSCTSLKSISGNIHYFGEASFSGSGIESVVIGNGNKEDESVFIGQKAFEGCKNLKSVEIRPKLKSKQNNTSVKSCSIQKYAFADCRNIETFVIDGYVDEIKEYAFSFNEINNVLFQYHCISSPQICSSLDPNNETMLLPLFSNKTYIINVSKDYQSNVFCPCDKLGCPIKYIENKEYDKIQNASVLIEKTLDELLVESSSNEQSESSNESNLNENSSNESESNENYPNESSSVEDESSENKNGDQNTSSSNKSSENELSGNEEKEIDENKATVNSFIITFLCILTLF